MSATPRRPAASAGSTRPRVVVSANLAWNLVNFRSNVLRAIIAAGYDLVAVAPPDEEAEAKLSAMGCSFVPLAIDSKGTSLLRDARVIRGYARLFRRLRPAAYLSYTIKPNLYGAIAARMCGVPAVANISGLGTAFLTGGWLNRLVRGLYRFGLRGAYIVYFQNQADRDLFLDQRLVRADQVKLLPGSGVDLAHFAPRPQLPEDGRAPTFLLVARLLWDKGIGEYVEAARIVRRAFPEARFQLLGFLGAQNRTAIDEATVKAWIEEGVVDYLGARDDVRAAMAEADCVVLPSYREGTSRVLLEAAAMAKPLIATDVPGCREVVDEGVNGLLCAVKNAQSLAAAMAAFARLGPEARGQMARASRAKVEREFDERIVIESYLAALAELAPRAGGPGARPQAIERIEN